MQVGGRSVRVKGMKQMLFPVSLSGSQPEGVIHDPKGQVLVFDFRSHIYRMSFHLQGGGYTGDSIGFGSEGLGSKLLQRGGI